MNLGRAPAFWKAAGAVIFTHASALFFKARAGDLGQVRPDSPFDESSLFDNSYELLHLGNAFPSDLSPSKIDWLHYNPFFRADFLPILGRLLYFLHFSHSWHGNHFLGLDSDIRRYVSRDRFYYNFAFFHGLVDKASCWAQVHCFPHDCF